MSKNQFRKVNDKGFQNIIVSVTSYDNEQVIEVQFGVRNELIESMVQQFIISSATYKPDANTLIMSIGMYNGTPYVRQKVKDSVTFDETLVSIQHFFLKEGFEFMNYSQDIKVIDELLNHEAHLKSKYIYNQVHRCFKGIAAAKLNDHPHLFGLIDNYRTQLLKYASDAELIEFERSVSYLLHFFAN
jgi:hypothetical protein